MAVSRRGFLARASAVTIGGLTLSSKTTNAVPGVAQGLPPYGNSTLPSGVRSRSVANVNGLTVHMMEAGY